MLEIIAGKLKIAVVDDVEIQAQFVQTMIKSCASEDVEVDYFTDPRVALESIKEGKYFAVFTDVHMEGMHGDDLVREINKMNLGVQTFVLTGDDGFILALNSFRLGCRRIFIKPPKKRLFEETVAEIENDFTNWRNTFEHLQERKRKRQEKKVG